MVVGNTHRQTQGFTLVEMAVVLIIIALITGGVLVGQSLISSARTKDAINEMRTIQLAMQTFNVKYDCLPGDCTYGQTLGFGFAYDGDGNGVIAQGSEGTWPNENRNFFEHLEDSGMQQFETTSNFNRRGFFPLKNTDIYVTGTVVYGNIPVSLRNKNYLCFTDKSLSGTWANGGLSLMRAYTIDNKIDDGLPQSGIFFSGDGLDDAAVAQPCVSGSAYDLSVSDPDALACWSAYLLDN